MVENMGIIPRLGQNHTGVKNPERKVRREESEDRKKLTPSVKTTAHQIRGTVKSQ